MMETTVLASVAKRSYTPTCVAPSSDPTPLLKQMLF